VTIDELLNGWSTWEKREAQAAIDALAAALDSGLGAIFMTGLDLRDVNELLPHWSIEQKPEPGEAA
jgi:hypothetical protein